MTERLLTVAVVGDPHFYVESSEVGDQVSHIRLGPNGDFLDNATRNPWLALKDYVAAKGLKADILLCVGDITVYAEKAGLEKAWKELLELGHLLGSAHVVSATGNHDVQSRGAAKAVRENAVRALSQTVGLFEPLKNLVPAYPIVEVVAGTVKERRDLRTMYFGNDIAMVEAADYRLAVLNSCCEHGPEPYQHDRGSFPKSAQANLSEALESATENKINLLVCHHPPGVHGEHDLGDYDFIKNGDGLLRCLERHGPWLVVHGHKHHGRITYAQGSNGAPVIFSASSLGYCLDVAKSGVRNQFYIIDLTQRELAGLRGQINAWDWNVGLGWVPATPDKGGIYDGCGFGHRCDLGDVASRVASIATPLPFKWANVISAMPEIQYLTPDDMDVLAARLASLKIVVEPLRDGSWYELEKENT